MDSWWSLYNQIGLWSSVKGDLLHFQLFAVWKSKVEENIDSLLGYSFKAIYWRLTNCCCAIDPATPCARFVIKCLKPLNTCACTASSRKRFGYRLVHGQEGWSMCLSRFLHLRAGGIRPSVLPQRKISEDLLLWWFARFGIFGKKEIDEFSSTLWPRRLVCSLWSRKTLSFQVRLVGRTCFRWEVFRLLMLLHVSEIVFFYLLCNIGLKNSTCFSSLYDIALLLPIFGKKSPCG
jgi:hypothetical protein